MADALTQMLLGESAPAPPDEEMAIGRMALPEVARHVVSGEIQL